MPSLSNIIKSKANHIIRLWFYFGVSYLLKEKKTTRLFRIDISKHMLTHAFVVRVLWMTKTDRTLFQCDFAIQVWTVFMRWIFSFFYRAAICWSCTLFFFNLHTHWLTHRSQFKRVTHFEPKSVICLFQQYSILNTSIKNSMCFDLIWRNLSTQPDSFFIVYYNFVITNQKNGVFTNVYEDFVYLLEKFVILYK